MDVTRLNDDMLITAAVLVIGLWNIAIAVLGLFPRFTSTAVGTLADRKTRKNVRTRGGRIIPNLTRYSYLYTVNGKQYRYSERIEHSKQCLTKKTTMVYIKWLPRRAYPNRFKGTKEWIWGIIMLYAGLRLLYTIQTGP